jgi:hypothetical protein
MMRNHISLLPLFLLRKIVQEEIDENGIDFRVGLELYDFATEELDGPYAAACGSY